jgi:uncharacterized protein
MWDILAEGMLGFVLVVDATRVGGDADAEAERIRQHFAQLADVPFVVLLNKVDGSHDVAAARWRQRMGIPDAVPVVAGDARDRDSTKQVLLTLLRQVLARVRDERPLAASSWGGAG